MRLIWGWAVIAALLVFSSGDASAQSQRGTIAVSVRVVRSSAPKTQAQTQTQTRLTETDGTSAEPATDASGQPVTTRSEGPGNIANAAVLASGDPAAPPTAPSSTPLNRFRVLTINY